jgi:hypothetical protein
MELAMAHGVENYFAERLQELESGRFVDGLMAFSLICRGDGAMHSGRARSMLETVVHALCWLRDEVGVVLTFGVIKEHIQFGKIIELADDGRLPEWNRKMLKSYLSSIPGYREGSGLVQGEVACSQHGYDEMQFSSLLQVLEAAGPSSPAVMSGT